MFPSRLALAALICLAPVAASAQAAAERAFVTALLNQLQDRSFAENREYCGYIGFDGSGRLTSGPVARGQMDSCEPQWPDNLDVIASADHIIDLGPEGGDGGGQIVATGTPASVAQAKGSATGAWLKGVLAAR